MRWLLVLIFVLCTPLVFGATLSGDLYNQQFESVTAVVTINTTPQQIKLGSSYSFDVPPGMYTLQAVEYDDDLPVSFYNNSFKVVSSGVFVYDLILFPVYDTTLDDVFVAPTEESSTSWWWLIPVVLAIILLAYFLFRPKKVMGKLEERMLYFITTQAHTTQKDVRNQFPEVSEAKISLVLSGLVQDGKIQKIKRGRGNIIRKI